MLLALQRYDIEVTYIPGSKVAVADALSRAPYGQMMSDLEEGQQQVFMTAETQGQLSDPTLDDIRTHTKEDPTMKSLYITIQNGWPEEQAKVSTLLKPYFHHREELTIEDGIIYKGDKCVIPAALRQGLLRKLHDPHMGIESTLRWARSLIYWPGMSSQIKDRCKRCDICQSFGTAQQKEPLLPHPIPTHPWQVVGADLFSINNEHFLVTTDYWSGFWELDKLQDMNSTTIILHLRRLFARYGIPVKLITDNGPQFVSYEFKDFARYWKFLHSTSSPYYPASNGKAESGVKTAKRLIKKALVDRKDPWMAILAYRNTVTEGMTTTPMERMMGRKARTQLPMKPSTLEASRREKDYSDTRDQLKARQEKQRKYYDRKAYNLPDLERGDTVRVQPKGQHTYWRRGIVCAKVAPRSFSVQLDNGTVIRRNRVQLRKVPSGGNDNSVPSALQGFTTPVDVATPERACAPECPDQYRTRYGRLIKKPVCPDCVD